MNVSKVLSGTIFFAFSAMLFGQPPAQGPPPASANAASWPVFSFNNLITGQVNATIASINNGLAARQDVRATIVPHVYSYSPIPTQTQYPDQPNSRYLSIPYILSFDINNIQYKAGAWLTYPWSRNVSISMNLNVFCNGWQTGNGMMTLVTQAQPPYLDQDHAITEQIVDQFLGGWLINYVDSQIMQSISGVTSSSSSFPFPCISLGAYYGDQNTVSDDAILWDRPVTLHNPILTALNTVTVRPISIQRLPAHSLDGGILYQPVESPMLEFWANFKTWDFQLPTMVENQVVPLSTAPSLTMPAPATGTSLVIIASTTEGSSKDSAWETFSSAQNWGAGTQTIVVSKVYWQPPHYPFTKPTKILVPAYQIIFQVTPPFSITTIGIGISF